MKRTLKILIVIVTILFTKQLSAQLYTNYVPARHPFKLLGGTYKKAYDLSHQGNNDEFITLMNQLIDSLEQVKDWDRYLLAQDEIATFYIQQSNPGKALEILKETEKKCKPFVDTLSTEYVFMYKVYWFSYYHLNDLKNAQIIADLRYKTTEKRTKERELNNKQLSLDLDTYDEIGITYNQISQFEKQYECVEKSFELAEKLNWDSRINNLYGQLAISLLGKGYDDYAHDFLLKDYHSNKLRNYYDSVMITGSLEALSGLYLDQNDFQKSLKLVERWDDILDSHPHPFPHQKALCQLKRGHVYGKMNIPDSAEYYYNQALGEITKTNKKSIEIEIYINLAKLYTEEKSDTNAAILFISKIDSIFNVVKTIDREIIEGYFLFLFDFYKNNYQLEQALWSIQRGLNYLADTVISDIYKTPEIPIHKIKRQTLKLYEAKINGLIEHFENNKIDNQFQVINKNFDLFNKYYLLILKENTNKKLIQKTLSNYRNTIDNVVEFCSQLETLNDEEKRILFNIICKGKGIELFIEKQKIEYNKLANNINQQSFNIESNKTKILQIENQLKLLNEENEKELIERLNDSLITLKRKTIITEMRLRYKALDNFNIEGFLNLHPEGIQSNTPPNTALIEYHLTNNHLIIISFTDSSFNVKIDKIENLNTTLKACYRKIKTGDNQIDESQFLYSKLIEPIEKEIVHKSNLIFILDKNLHNIPFEILASKKKCLIEHYNISYAYSSSLWNSSAKDKKLLDYRLLAVAPIFNLDEETGITNANFRGRFENDSLIFRSSKVFQPLLFTESEVTEIANIFEQNSKVRKVITGDNATKEKFVSELVQANIIHIATHGLVNKENPYLSGIALFPKKEEYNNNDIFYHYELYDKKINAELVVLSACQTGTGKLLKGEGVMALPRGFIYAGVPNVIASLWKVHDEKTKDLMVAFYKHLLEDKVSYAEALRLAKLDCIEKGFLPLDWAGFILIGN